MEDVEKKNINYQSSHSNLKTNSSTKKKHTRLFETPPDLGKVFFKRFPWL